MQRLVEASIQLGRLVSNYRLIREFTDPHVKIMAVIKGNAYGHGDIAVARALEDERVDYFGVACLYEGISLRKSGITSPILLLGYTDKESVREAIENDLSLTVIDAVVLLEIEKIGQELGKKPKIHVKIDTGMHRFGLSPSDALQFLLSMDQFPHVELEGIFTHFATSDEKDLSFSHLQLELFTNFLADLAKLRIRPKLIHCANSAALMRLRSSHFSMVRAGKILYGPLPGDISSLPFYPEPILSLQTKIVQLGTVKEGEYVGYGREYQAQSDRVIATIPVGYADGFRRSPKNFAIVLVRGQKAPVVGRVSMDQSTIDVTAISGVSVFDEVVLLGEQGGERITMQQIAQQLGTNSYEVLTSLSARVTRRYTHSIL